MKDQLIKIPEGLKKIQDIKDELVKAILELPDNPNIHRISEHPNCFTMSSKEIFGGHNSTADMRITNNFSVFFYDFKQQYEKITEVISKGGAEHILATLDYIVKNGHLKGKDYCLFHPQVIAHLRSMLET